jgi:hypothetical protein
VAKTIASKKAALDASFCSLANPYLVLLGAAPTAESIHDPAGWTEVAQFATTNRISLSGKMPKISSAVTDTSTSPDTVKVVAPTADVDAPAGFSGNVTVYGLAIVDGTAALGAGTLGRVVDITDKPYTTGDIARFAANSWTARE